MTLPAILPDWMPWWLQFLLWTGGVILGLATIVMPFIVIGMRGRLTYVSEQLDEVHAELRMLAQRMPEPISAARYEALRAATVSRAAADDGAYRAPQRSAPPVEPRQPPRERPVDEYRDDYRPAPRPDPRPGARPPERHQWRDEPRNPARDPGHDGGWEPRDHPDPVPLPGLRPTLEPRPPLGLPLPPQTGDDRRDPPPRPPYYRDDGHDDDGENDPGYERRLSPPFRPHPDPRPDPRSDPRPGPRPDPRHEPRLRWPPREN